MGVSLVTGPSVEPISPVDVRTWGQIAATAITGEYADAVINQRIKAAREIIEARAKIALVNQTWALTLDSFGASDRDGFSPDWGYRPAWAGDRPIYLPLFPWQSITSIQYVAPDGTTQTLSSSLYRFDSAEGRITPEYLQLWPITRTVINAVTITFVVGYGADGTFCPAMARECLLEIVEDRLKNRGGLYQIPNGTLEKIRSLWSGRV